MKVLIIDNYDSFTFNLYQYAGELLDEKGGAFRLDVERNDAITLKEIASRRYERIIISPGPGDPTDRAYFGICSDVLLGPAKELPVLGVCLGMQGMAAVYGGNVRRAKLPMHGKTSLVKHDGKGVFQGLPDNLQVMRYHSLIVERNSLPDCFEETAVSQDSEELMGIRHREYRHLEGIQFHPESFATEGGMEMLRNFLFPG
ncbi:anthranilate synthase component II [Leptonema illini]|uniref:Glutamine amidotransferase of anthranilate synthase n=1 Tax=Leptonema illini DSM 21528 TaxID=929563 RepID=H2CIJ3_9LEPT|nr:aminodeoxychorismate/anthranilate synthase component II [Leptonema illini]EHQ05986.1 glutamine amidotransferase of anthranilate synthase [Leptonema illini DSM 21528]